MLSPVEFMHEIRELVRDRLPSDAYHYQLKWAYLSCNGAHGMTIHAPFKELIACSNNGLNDTKRRLAYITLHELGHIADPFSEIAGRYPWLIDGHGPSWASCARMLGILPISAGNTDVADNPVNWLDKELLAKIDNMPEIMWR